MGPLMSDKMFLDHQGGQLGPRVSDVKFKSSRNSVGPRVSDVKSESSRNSVGLHVSDVKFGSSRNYIGPCISDVKFGSSRISFRPRDPNKRDYICFLSQSFSIYPEGS